MTSQESWFKSHWKGLICGVASFGSLVGLCYWKWKALRSWPAVANIVDALTKHPVIASIASTVVFVIAAFARKIWKALEESWTKSIAEAIDAEVRLLLSGFRKRYYRQLRYRHRFFNVRGLRTQGTYTLELEKVFVELRMAPCNLQEAATPPFNKR